MCRLRKRGAKKSQIKVVYKSLLSELINHESVNLNSRHVKLILGRHARAPGCVTEAPICSAVHLLPLIHVHESGIVFSQNHSSLKNKTFSLALHSIFLSALNQTRFDLRRGLKENISISFQFPEKEENPIRQTQLSTEVL